MIFHEQAGCILSLTHEYNVRETRIVFEWGGTYMKFYTIKLPKFLGGIVRAMLGTFKKG